MRSFLSAAPHLGAGSPTKGHKAAPVDDYHEFARDALGRPLRVRGLLKKQGGSRNSVGGFHMLLVPNRKNWKERYFVLDLHAGVLKYYEDQDCLKLAGTLKFLATLTVLRPYKKKTAVEPNSFELVGTADEDGILRDGFPVIASDTAEFCEWIRSIDFCLACLNGDADDCEQDAEESEAAFFKPPPPPPKGALAAAARAAAPLSLKAVVPPIPAPPPAPPTPPSRSLKAHDFEPIQILGKGAFGAVLLVTRRGGNASRSEFYAMKVLNKKRVIELKMQDKAQVEREVLLQVRHAFLCRLRYSFQSRTKLYLVCDYYAGGSLEGALARERVLSVDAARFISAELALGLAELHRVGVLHRDIKAANVLLDAQGHACLADFGLARLARSNKRSSFAGTLEYMAPEMLRKADKCGPALDWWGVGVLLYEMVHGKTPFVADTARQVFINILREEPKIETDDDFLRSMLRLLLNKQPQSRLRSVRDLAAQPFFRALDFARLEAKALTPPYVPEATRVKRTSSCSDAQSATKMCYDDSDDEDDEANPFKGFAFTQISEHRAQSKPNEPPM
ncbi:kinase-like domain-containing protein [Pelagophyceae sp. CCMP2097]|nr:kinase-like domain-containing protein [Pelagophyceae sp. CCMP2097]